MTHSVFIIALFISLISPSFAYAQWQFSAGAGVRQVRVTETDKNDRQLVREHGWLPGLELRADYAVGDWRIGAVGETYRERIAYDGQLQNGVAFSSDTQTAQSRISVEAARQLSDTWRLVGGLEWDRWQRTILGRNGVLGLSEQYSSWRVLAGAETRLLQWPAAAAHVKALVVIAQPEQLHVRFDNQLFDDADFSTKSAVGLRLALRVEANAMPKLSFTTDFDWLRIARSGDAALLKNGVQAGFVSQPEHQRCALGVRVNYRF